MYNLSSEIFNMFFSTQNIPFPLSLTVVQLLTTFSIVSMVRKWSFPVCREDKPLLLSWKDYALRVSLPGKSVPPCDVEEFHCSGKALTENSVQP